MMRSHVVGSVGLILLGQACGGTPPPVIVRPPPLVITAAPPPAVRARWVFNEHERSFAGKLDLGKDVGVLYVGTHGRRELVKGEDAPVDATTLALDDLIGVLRDPKGQYAFVADDGDVYVGKDAMGALESTRPGPVTDTKGATLLSTTTGKAVVMGITSNDHRLLRTTDFGATWKPVDYAGSAKPWGRPIAIALDSKGNGVLIHVPQRVFVTHDDGATWAPIASPGIGAKDVSRDGADKLFIQGFDDQRARLDGNALVVTTDSPEPIYKPNATPLAIVNPDEKDKGERTDTVTFLAGDHIVDMAAIYRHGKNREVEITTAKMGDKNPKAITNTDLVGREGLSQHVAAWGSNIMYLRQDDDADDNAPTSTLFLSSDYGATWAKDITIEGSEPQSDGVDVMMGPKGWAFVANLCANGESYGGGDDDEGGGGGAPNCGTRKIRSAGATAFEDMAFTEEFVPTAFVFDEAHDKVYALGTHDSDQHMYQSALSQNKWVRTKFLDGLESTADYLSVDAKGTLRAFDYEYNKGWVVIRQDADAKELPKEYLSLDQGDMTFVGARGLLLAGHNKGWETADGGETWIRVATNGSRSADCSEAGCMSSDAVRIGWDLPAAASDEKILATADPPAKPKQPDAVPPNSPPAPPTAELACKPSGAATTVSQAPSFDMADNRADVRWAQIKHDSDGKTSLIVGGKSAVREVALLAAEPKAVAAKAGSKAVVTEYRSGDRTLADGVVAARYTFQSKSSTGSFNPVDVDLTWFSFSTGKVGHHTLPKLKPFRVSSYGLTGDAQIVTGGLLYQALDQEPAFFVHDDGKVDTIPLPPRASVRNALHVGSRFLLADSESGTLQLAWSDDNGKSWQQKAWTLDESSSSTSLLLMGGKPTVALSRGGSPLALFGIDTVVPEEPPTPIVMDVNGSINNTCDSAAGPLRLSMYVPSDKRFFKARIDNGKKTASLLSASNRATHGLATGKSCTAAYQLSGDGQTAIVYADGTSWSGWRFRHNDDPKKSTMLAEPISCK